MIWGLIVFYFLNFIGMLFIAHKHGESREPYNFWAYFIATIIELVLFWWALGWRFW